MIKLEAALAGSEAARREMAIVNDKIPESANLAARAAEAEVRMAEMEIALQSAEVSKAETVHALQEEIKDLKVF